MEFSIFYFFSLLLSKKKKNSLIIVKYGDNSEKIFNPNCVSSVLLSFIKISCGFDDENYQVDLATESGEVIDLANHGKEYAKKYLDG